ncbi:hypothetical protein CPB84DRAFT_1791458 [Gymnopilus junonius]|uniref:Uncharacterized protein n=1 Tax=Gymnopilus junonius TaxID=109634 RepID=A0A9P5NDV7_GYMJU|nr:hypothetical protein CPB84DRAFT_1791458 [Gymnopilus junonius]
MSVREGSAEGSHVKEPGYIPEMHNIKGPHCVPHISTSAPILHHFNKSSILQSTSHASLSDARTSNAAFNPSYVPTAIITGATAGIGQSIAEALSRRNRSAAESIIASLPKLEASQDSASESTYEFVQCDMTIIKNVHNMAKDLNERLSKVNFLVHCAAIVGLGGRKEADPKEGLDEKMATLYYARWKLTYDLLPLLRKAKEEARKPVLCRYLVRGLRRSDGQSNCYNDLMIAEFAAREPDIAFTHIHPGAVYTGTMVNKGDCAEHMLSALLSAKKGMNRRNWKGDDIGMKKFPQKEGAQKALWDHTLEATSIDE